LRRACGTWTSTHAPHHAITFHTRELRAHGIRSEFQLGCDVVCREPAPTKKSHDAPTAGIKELLLEHGGYALGTAEPVGLSGCGDDLNPYGIGGNQDIGIETPHRTSTSA
jgi:hypothetical protein